MAMDMKGDRGVTPFLQTANLEDLADFSPDGRWVAYSSDSSGQLEVYLRSHPDAGNPIRISRSGGAKPFWSRDGKSIYYRDEDRLMAVPIDSNSGRPTADAEEILTLGEGFLGFLSRQSSELDGTRILSSRYNLEATQYQIRIEFDWTKRLEALVGGAR